MEVSWDIKLWEYFVPLNMLAKVSERAEMKNLNQMPYYLIRIMLDSKPATMEGMGVTPLEQLVFQVLLPSWWPYT
jgi:hypothetical protein